MDIAKRTFCSFPRCRRSHHAHGLCKAHDQQRRSGIALASLRTRAVRVYPYITQRYKPTLWISQEAIKALWSSGDPKALIEKLLEDYARTPAALALQEDEEPLP